MQDSRGILNGIGERCILKSPSVRPAFFPHHWPSVFSPSARATESNCPTTSYSRSYRDSLSGLAQTLPSFAHRPRPLLYLLLLACTLPRPPISKSQTALPHSSAPPIAGWHIEFSSITQPLRSTPLSGVSPLLQVVPPLSSASVRSPLWFFHLWLLRWHQIGRASCRERV